MNNAICPICGQSMKFHIGISRPEFYSCPACNKNFIKKVFGFIIWK